MTVAGQEGARADAKSNNVLYNKTLKDAGNAANSNGARNSMFTICCTEKPTAKTYAPYKRKVKTKSSKATDSGLPKKKG